MFTTMKETALGADGNICDQQAGRSFLPAFFDLVKSKKVIIGVFISEMEKSTFFADIVLFCEKHCNIRKTSDWR